MPSYLPYSERRPSTQYRDLLRTIRDDGIRVETKQGEGARAVAGHAMRFPMAHGAAIITERSIERFVSKAIGELCAFINGARTLEQLAAFGCDWWDPWASSEKCAARGLEPGDLGPGSYGHAFRNFTTDLDGEDPGWDQLPNLIKKLQDLPLDRTALLSPWIPNANHREEGVRSCTTSVPATRPSASPPTWRSTRRSA
jgi:thymidylate synthase